MHINVVVIGHVDSGKSTTTGKPASTLNLCLEHRTHTHNRSLDLQVRRYRQAYHREVREGKNSTPLLPLHINFHLIAIFLPLGGVEIRFPQSAKFCARTLLARQRALVAAQQSISLLHRINFSCSAADPFYRKPPSSPSISLSGSSRPPNTMSPSLVSRLAAIDHLQPLILCRRPWSP